MQSPEQLHGLPPDYGFSLGQGYPATKNQVLLARHLWENINPSEIQYSVEMVTTATAATTREDAP
jgi:hypothetical protein